jgi:hypothetical protein
MLHSGVTSIAAAAKPAMNSNVNLLRLAAVCVSGVNNSVPSNTPAVEIDASDPKSSPTPTTWLSQKPSNAPLRSAAKRQSRRITQLKIAVRLVRKIKNTIDATKYAQPIRPRMPYQLV